MTKEQIQEELIRLKSALVWFQGDESYAVKSRLTLQEKIDELTNRAPEVPIYE
jgi:hypothetical protein